MRLAERDSAVDAGMLRAPHVVSTRQNSTVAIPSRHCARTPLKEKAWDQHIILLMTTPGKASEVGYILLFYCDFAIKAFYCHAGLLLKFNSYL